MNNLLFLFWFCFSVVKKVTGHIAAIYRREVFCISVPDGERWFRSLKFIHDSLKHQDGCKKKKKFVQTQIHIHILCCCKHSF